jgi:hypothetical protein
MFVPVVNVVMIFVLGAKGSAWPKGNGTVYVDARMDLRVWRLTRLELVPEGSDRRIDLGASAPRKGPLLPLD